MKKEKIRTLNFCEFRKNRKQIEKCIIYHCNKKNEITLKELYRTINLIIFGVDIANKDNLNRQRSYNQCITQPVQIFYFKQDKPCLILLLEMEIKELEYDMLPDIFAKNDIIVSNIKVRIFQ